MIRDCAEDCEEKIEPRTRFALSPGVTVRELDWDYFPPEGIPQGSEEWENGYQECLHWVARWYENEHASYRLAYEMSKK